MTVRRASDAPVVRIFAGRWKGRKLEAPRGARPTSGRARQALFNLLASRVAGAHVLELYAGSGAVGIEAVSRGAAQAVFVEQDAGPLRRSLERLGGGASGLRLIAGSASAACDALARSAERFDIVFADPPYAPGPEETGLALVAGLLADGGVFVLQEDAGAAPAEPPGLALRERRAYGRNVFSFFGML
jgi:16S rRNA (guanine966-N2)-methyltransferase